jgi:hypothetical protein
MDRNKKLVAANAAAQNQQVAPDAKTLEYFLASGLGSRGGPNKVSNKLKRCPRSYAFH